MENLKGTRQSPLVAQPAKITIQQAPDGSFKLTHNIIKPMFLIGVLSTTLNNVIGAAIQQEQMIVDPNKPQFVPTGEPEKGPENAS